MALYYPPADDVRLAEYVGLPGGPTAFVTQCARDAAELVATWLGEWSALDPGVPFDVLDRAILEVGAELFHRKNTKNAVAQFATPDGSPVRIARDPMVAAYPLLRPWIGGGFA